MNERLIFALVIGCALTAFACDEEASEGGGGDCPAMLHLTVGELEVSADDALADYTAEEGCVILEIEADNIAAVVYEGENFEELFGEEEVAMVLWEVGEEGGELVLESYSYQIEETGGNVTGTLEGTGVDGSAVSLCWDGLENTTL